MGRLFLAFPMYTMVESYLVAETLKLTHGQSFEFGTADSLYAYHNLNMLIARALSMPLSAWDRFTIIEQDHRYPTKLLSRVEQLEDPVVGALYWKRKEGEIGVPVPGWWRDGRLVPLSKADVADMHERPGLHPVDVLGTSVMSIRRDVLRDWPRDRPWFRTDYEGRKLIGYETWFCLQCKAAGIPVMLDSRLELEHYARLPVRDTR